MKEWSNLLSLLAIFATTAAIFALWVFVVRRFYRIRATQPAVLKARCQDGWELAVHYRPARQRRFAEPVLLCHGLAANHHTFDFEPPYSLAHTLSEQGFDCFSVDLRGSRASHRPPTRRGPQPYCADEHIRQDGPALVELALGTTGATSAFWIGHSLGALIGLGVAQGDSGSKLSGLVSVGAPVFFSYESKVKAAVRWGALLGWPFRFRQEIISAALAPFLGYTELPFSDVIVSPRHIPPRIQRQLYAQLITSVSRRLLLQLRDWIENNAFRSFDRTIDYRKGIKALRIPLLVIGGNRDQLAPIECVTKTLELAGSPDKTIRLFGLDQGASQNFGHADLLFGEAAPKDVFPVISTWLQSRATPLDLSPRSEAQDLIAPAVRPEHNG
jgi:pimeloyl-ACP methyl ester carboxylesterase